MCVYVRLEDYGFLIGCYFFKKNCLKINDSNYSELNKLYKNTNESKITEMHKSHVQYFPNSIEDNKNEIKLLKRKTESSNDELNQKIWI